MDASLEKRQIQRTDSATGDDAVPRPRSSTLWSSWSPGDRGQRGEAIGIRGLVQRTLWQCRVKTVSESDSWTESFGRSSREDSSLESIEEVKAFTASSLARPEDSAGSAQRNLSFGNSERVVYDIDGKFPYIHHEPNSVLYDLDGKHRYEYYRHFQQTPFTKEGPDQGK